MDERRSNGDSRGDETPPANPFDRLTYVFLVRDSIRPAAAQSIRDVAAAIAGDRSLDGPSELTGIDGVHTASVFLDESTDEPSLSWYLEVDRTETRSRDLTEATVTQLLRTQSPLYVAGLDAFQPTSNRSWAVGGPLTSENVFTHTWHPERPRAPVAFVERDGPVFPSAASDDPSVEVALVELRVKPGVASWLVEWMTTQSHGASGG